MIYYIASTSVLLTILEDGLSYHPATVEFASADCPQNEMVEKGYSKVSILLQQEGGE
jgi:hypothetical protein